MKKPLVIGLLLAAIVALASYVAAGPYLALHGIRTALAINVGTCTQGDATRLWGGVLTVILYGVACILLSLRSS